MKKKILVTGAGGQLGLCIKELSEGKGNLDFVFANSNVLDITNKESVISLFNTISFDYCINCAAYTAVDKAEENKDEAYLVNVVGPKNLAEICSVNNTTLIHVSTDFVFDGQANVPYVEEDKTSPISVYGSTKLGGEEEISIILDNYFIIRTSWLYSEYGSNFVKTMLKLGNTRDELTIINDQIGSPTYAKDLAKAIIKIIVDDSFNYGLYHYSNEGVASWFDFAKAIFEIEGIDVNVGAIPMKDYPTPAKRPHFSVLDKSKIKDNLKITVPYWRDSLKECLKKNRLDLK